MNHAVATNFEIVALFDLDGTLLRAGDPVHVAAFEHALRVVFGASTSLAGLELAGRLDLAIATAALARQGVEPRPEDPRVREVMTIMGRYYRLRVAAGEREDWVLDGVIDLLRKLRAAGVATVVASGSAREVAEAKLASAGLSDYFPAGAFGDEAGDRPTLLRQAIGAAGRVYRRGFAQANAVVIGDTPADVEAARAIGARVVAVATGRYSSDDLDEHVPDATFPDLGNADAVIKAILRG